jgi:hypothetical protein
MTDVQCTSERLPGNSYSGFETRQEAEKDYLRFLREEKGGQISSSRAKDFIILVQFIVIMYLLLSWYVCVCDPI